MFDRFVRVTVCGLLACLLSTALCNCGGGDIQPVCVDGILFGSAPDEEAKALLERLEYLGLVVDIDPVEEVFMRCDCGCAADHAACAPCDDSVEGDEDLR